ncbi:WxL protein peptidoglycan domain-containing protein [Subtercola endophyticus]|uniref:WxL protein peptidoglycan domain-containing protein n=1 Tax=Subtercola endophyticus TaxID=2895559 RepID=UPI001E58FA07|nr:DUF916 domain-containing protein [Subtercola endophyticus]UFS59217.1 hypothetical protein LQ955_19945 [Subtercola endophyticus]
MPDLAALFPRFKRLVALVLAVAFVSVLMVSLQAAGSARADDTAGISGAPSNGTGTDTRSRFSYQLAPGQHIDDAYQVKNTGTVPQTMKVFATDAYNTDDGSYGLLDTDATPTDAGNWITFAGGAKQLSIPLDPGASQIVPFSLDVPADASPGDHAAGIVISVLTPDGQVLVDRRVATRLYARVEGDLQAALTISSISASYDSQFNPFDGAATVTYTIRNNGNVALSANTVTGVNTYFGIGAAGQVRGEVAEMLPGSTRTVSVTVPGVAQLGYLNPYVSLAPTVDPDALNPGQLTTVNRDTVLIAMPWWLVILLVIAAIVLLITRIRRRRDEKNALAWAAYTEAEAHRKAAEDLVGSGAASGDSPGRTR